MSTLLLRLFRTGLVCGLFFPLLNGFSQSIGGEKEEHIAIYLDTALHKFNGVFVLVSKDSVIYSKTQGYATFKPRKPLEETSIFELASVSKQFTAAAILQLVEQGKLNENDYLGKFFPNFPYKGITIHHLLTHQSGLPEYMDFKNKYWKDSKLSMNNKDLLNILVQYQPKKLRAPGQKFEYNNTGYALLALIVAQVSKMSFEDYVCEHLFKPAGMTETFFYTQTLSKSSKVPEYLRLRMVKGYDLVEKERSYDYECGIIGDKGVFSTANDMLLWYKALKNNMVLSPEIQKKMTTAYILSNEKDHEYYGYGLRIISTPEEEKYIYHGGLWRGFTSLFFFDPEEDFLMLVLSNYFNKAHYGKRQEVFNILKGLDHEDL